MTEDELSENRCNDRGIFPSLLESYGRHLPSSAHELAKKSYELQEGSQISGQGFTELYGDTDTCSVSVNDIDNYVQV